MDERAENDGAAADESAAAGPARPTRGRPGRPRVDEDGQRSRRRDIVRAAVAVFAERGYHAARVSDIAAVAGVAHGLVYHYFSSKDELLREIFRSTWSNIEQGLATIRDSEASASERLAGVVRLMLGSYRLAPDLVRVVVLEVTRSGQLRSQVAEVEQAFLIIERIIRDGQESGELRADIDARFASYAFWGAIDEVLTGWVFGTLPAGDDDLATAEQAVVEVALGGLRSRPDA